ncbi:MAG: hypothetical protein HY973_02855 [Candidatus Kerfeldbacteria bacterium]|nr:hypothetical protein [Candidatus Kerfeldbacteria bacterium]
MKQKIIKFIISLLVIVGGWLPLAVSAGTSEAVSYLKIQTPNEWVTMALVAGGETLVAKDYLKTFSGSSATDYAKRILAIVAVGENPRTFASTDLIAGLKAKAVSGQIGDVTLLNDDAWGILALRAAGESASDSVVAGAKNFLLTNQQPDGSWGWQAGGGSDTNDTAAVLMALAEVGLTYNNSVVQNGFNYLRSNQQLDGGFPYDLAWPASDSGSTAWIMSALYKFNQNPDTWVQGSATPTSFLQSLQIGNGSFKWQSGDAGGLTAMTAYALVALTNSFYPVASLRAQAGSGRRNRMVNIKLTVDLSASEFQAGDLVNLRVRLENLGPDNAQEIDVINVLPESLPGAVAILSSGVWQADKNQWLVSGLAKGASADLKFSFVAPEVVEEKVWANLARAITPSDDEFDQTDNQTSYTFTVTPKVVTPVPPTADLPEVGTATSLNSQIAPKVLGISNEHCSAQIKLTSPNQNLDAWRGQFLKTTDSQLVYYVDATSGQIYCLDNDQAAQQLLSLVGLGINQADISKIPELGESLNADKFSAYLVSVLAGRILLNVETGGSAWYVAKDTGQRTYLGVFGYARETMRNLAVTVEERLLKD